MKSFQELELFEPLEKRLAELEYTTPTPIQAQTIPAAIEGKDILGCAQTGTGKTAAFALPILDFLGHEAPRAASGRPLALVLAPTRELAIQIGQSFHTYGKHVRFRQTLVYGGVGQNEQVRSLNKGAHVLIATPGRLIDLMEQGHVRLSDIEILVLDEADRMLDMGFMPAIKKIIAKLPQDRQSLFFSATLPPKIRELADQLLFNPFQVNVTPKTKSVEQIDQSVRMMDRCEKVDQLVKVLRGDDVLRSIVFTRTKHGANALTRKLEKQGITATAIHGNKSQAARQRALSAFRDNRISVLVATDVAARGIDIDDVTHVVNFDMPMEPESYVHRVGRTGRAGANGIAISFCTVDERDKLREIEKLIDQPLRIQNPGAKLNDTASKPAKSSNFGGRNGSRNNGSSSANGNRRPKKRFGKGGWNKRRATAKA
ncbi:ATP-dependent RNA helicase RhlE [Stieleria neptunia]|uniref:ATP-dependent RNA helicase RhlE n=1 Tax=Stieleria neptunia TaxID=2527979 RepID=A0A518I006_9BACT|nr:DEAD/DEAH box helicase [Stieleria neptunia]QDV46439.1 ATP-dependent RNA helicase RhlE [Stieleria neptunia]